MSTRGFQRRSPGPVACGDSPVPSFLGSGPHFPRRHPASTPAARVDGSGIGLRPMLSSLKGRFFIGVAVAAAALLGLSAPALAAAGDVTIRTVDTTAYPTV